MIFGNKKIEFIPSSKDTELFIEPPQSAKKLIPEWYKNLPNFDSKNLEFFNTGKLASKSLKMCIPFIDALTTGYIVTTWTDIHIKFNLDGSVVFNYPSGPEIIQIRDNVNISLGEEYYPIEFTWVVQWLPKTPKGYGIIFTHPFNNLNLPFTTLSGVVDTDNFYHTARGNYPFYIKKGFEGIIPKGTPMYQLIPYKKHNWKSVIHKFDSDEVSKRDNFMYKMFYGTYKKLFWDRKNYS
jgi:hypothetical protein